jgi:hypothetical protein
MRSPFIMTNDVADPTPDGWNKPVIRQLSGDLLEQSALAFGALFVMVKYVLPRVIDYRFMGNINNASLIADLFMLPLLGYAISMLALGLAGSAIDKDTSPTVDLGASTKALLEQNANQFEVRQILLTGITSYN